MTGKSPLLATEEQQAALRLLAGSRNRGEVDRARVMPLLEQPVADRRNWTIHRLRVEIEAREGVRISCSQLSKAHRKKSSVGGVPDTR